MTLPTTNTTGNNNNNGNNSNANGSCDDDSDMFGPPRCSPPMGYHHHRSRVPMISPKLRQREERKRILQLCAHKLERIKDSEANLRRSVCINNTYCRLTDELKREKQMRYQQNLPKIENGPETGRENLFQPNMDDAKPQNKSNDGGRNSSSAVASSSICSNENEPRNNNNNNSNHSNHINANSASSSSSSSSSLNAISTLAAASDNAASRKRSISSSNLVNDLEILDRELSAINAPMPLLDPEITQGAEQLEKAALSSSRKRLRSNSCEDESDRLVREALSQFYIPPQRLISAIEDCPVLDVVGLGMGGATASSLGGGGGGDLLPNKRAKLGDHHHHHLVDLVDFDMNQNQKDFEVIMDALRLGTPSPGSSASDSCGQAAMMSESSASVFYNLVVTSLET